MGEEKRRKQLEDKAKDYRQFGILLLSLSTFLYIGLLLPIHTRPEVLLISIFLGLAVALFFLYIAIHTEQKLNNDS